MLLGPACSAVIAVVGTKSSLTSDTIVAREATAGAGGTVASPFIGALDPRMEIIGIYHVSDPSEILGAGALRAIWTGPFGLTIQTCEAQAVVVELAGAVVGAVVLAEAALSVSSLIKSDLTPSLGRVGRSSGWIVAWLGGRLRGRLGCRLSGKC